MQQDCYHCGEPIPSGFKAELSVSGQPQAFCCYGCMAIAETIISGGMESFYKHRSELSEKASEFTSVQQGELRLFDTPELQADFVDEFDTYSVAHLSISGITCAACIWLLEREISKLDGVQGFSVNHTTHKARLQWNKRQLPLSDILIKIRRLGYQAHPYQEDQVRQRAHKERRTSIIRIAVAGIATMQNMMFSVPLYLGIYSGIDKEFLSLFRWVSMLMCIPVVCYAALPFFKAALRDLKTRHLTMDIPVSLAIIGAFLASSYVTIFTEPSIESDVYFDSVSMFTFFLLVGRFLEMLARHKHLNTDIELGALLPATALVRTESGEASIPARKIQAGDQLIVRQGQLIPVDGIVIEGSSRIDESALTGEFIPVPKRLHDHVSGGTANVENTLVIEATATLQKSRVSAILQLLDQAQSEKPRTVELADHIASYFVLFVLLATLGVGVFWTLQGSDNVFAIVLSVLVVTCPCALSLATPTAMTAANTALRKKGFLMAKAHVLEAMTQITDIIFDKTGTLTQGKLALQHTLTHQCSEQQALEVAAALEDHSSHPIAQVFKPYFTSSASQVSTDLGKGIRGEYQGKLYRLGTLHYAQHKAQQNPFDTPEGITIYLADDENLLAQFVLSDELRESSEACVEHFKSQGIEVHILSGDQEQNVAHIAKQIHVDHWQFEQSPEQKLAYVKRLETQGKQIAMVGDGINDLPVLSGARLSIAMGAASDITKLNSDAILLNNHPEVLNETFDHAITTRSIIKQNMAWAIGYNLVMLPLAGAGWVPPYFAALGMSLSSLIVVLNSLRLTSTR